MTWLVVLGLLVCTACFAQGPEKAIELEEVTVTATRTERLLRDVPSYVTVIERQEIERSTARSVDQVLKYQAGVTIYRPWGPTSTGSWGQIYLRGFPNQKRTLILLDGVPLNDMYSGAAFIEEIPLEDVERIEVLRGGSSALWGSRALGGVVNIITRGPAKRPRLTLMSSYESELETWEQRLSFTGQRGRLGWWATVGGMETAGYRAATGEKVLRYNEENRDKRKDDALLKLTYELSANSSLSLMGEYYHERVGAGRRYYRGGQTQRRYRLDYRRKGRVDWLASFRFSDLDHTWVHGTSTKVTKKYYRPMREWDALLQASFPLNAWNHLTVGADYRRGHMVNAYYWRTKPRHTRTNGKQQLASLFLEDELSLLGDRLLITLGGRLDWYENFNGRWYDSDSPPRIRFDEDRETSFNPRLGVRYRLTEDTSLRGSVGRAFAAPTLYELYNRWGGWGKEWRGNPDLDPETCWSYELGVDHRVGSWLLGRLTLFYNEADDFITSVYQGEEDGTEVYQYDNVGDVRTYGLEAEVRWRLSPRLSGFLTYTYTRAYVKHCDEKPELAGNRLGKIPRYKASFGVTFSDPRLLTASLTGVWKDTRDYSLENDPEKRMGGYFTCDLSLSRRIADRVRLSLELGNLFNNHFHESYNYRNPGRTICFRVRTEF